MSIEEKIQEYIKNGGVIHKIAPHDDLYASHRTRWHLGGINNNRKQYLKKNSVATAPGGGIEPRRPSKSWSTPRKTTVTPVVAGMSAAEQFNIAVIRITDR